MPRVPAVFVRLGRRGYRVMRRRRRILFARSLIRAKLTYATEAKLVGIADILDTLLRDGVPGDFLETGVGRGGSAILICRCLDDDRVFHGYDVFAFIPAPTTEDPAKAHQQYARIERGEAGGIEGDPYKPETRTQIHQRLLEYGISPERFELHEGLIEDTLQPNGPVAFAHVDCDWYKPVKASLERIYTHLSPGGMIVVDDYYAWGGARKATHEFLADRDDMLAVNLTRGEHLVLQRLKSP